MVNNNSRAAYSKADVGGLRKRVLDYIRANQGHTSIQIMQALGVNIRNCGRLTELANAGYIIAVGDISRYYISTLNKTYDKNDFKGSNSNKSSKDRRIAEDLGFIFLNNANADISKEQKDKVINNIINYYNNFILSKNYSKFAEDLKTVNKLLFMYVESKKYGI